MILQHIYHPSSLTIYVCFYLCIAFCYEFIVNLFVIIKTFKWDWTVQGWSRSRTWSSISNSARVSAANVTLSIHAGCPIYGDLECVRYKGMEFNIGESQNSETPHPMSIHYLVLPNYLLVPDFVLLEDISPSSLEELLQIIKGISEMALDGEVIGVGQKRIAHRDRWGVVG